MDVEILARMQFALTIMFHYIYPPLSIGLGLILVIIEGIYLKTKNPLYLDMAKFWTKVFALYICLRSRDRDCHGVRVRHQLGNLFPLCRRRFRQRPRCRRGLRLFPRIGFPGHPPLRMEQGWSQNSFLCHANGMPGRPLQRHMDHRRKLMDANACRIPYRRRRDGARAEIIDFWAMVFNPSSIDQPCPFCHRSMACRSLLVISVSAYYMFKRNIRNFAKASMKIGLIVAIIACVLQLISGDSPPKSSPNTSR